MTTAKQLFTNQSSNGNSSTFTGNGIAQLKISGTFDGASIDLECTTNNDNDSFGTTGDDAITAPGAWNINYTPNVRYRLVLSSAGASTDINAFVSQ